MNFCVLTIFPEILAPFWQHGIIRRAIEQKTISGSTLNIRDFADGKHRVTDDRPYGGGSGMVMKPEPIAAAITEAKTKCPEAATVLLSPQGRVFDHQTACMLAKSKGLILVCGRYEGVDERVDAHYIDHEISIGDFVLTGGELAAMLVIDAVTRQLPGALGGEDAAEKDSFSNGLLEHAQYTRPRIFKNEAVPEVLLSGHHAEIETWRLEDSMIRTFFKRPDLLENRKLSREESEILTNWYNRLGRIVQSQS
jgi:tRNA (guanine37-N1)-methyltransferase